MIVNCVMNICLYINKNYYRRLLNKNIKIITVKLQENG